MSISTTFIKKTGAAKKRYTQNWQRVVLFLARKMGERVQKMPRQTAMAWATRLGRWAYKAARKKRGIALSNLRLAQFPSPGASEAEQARLVEGVFVHFAKVFVDFLRGPVFDPRELASLQSIITECEGFAHIRAAQASGKGVILLTAHLGNWELQGRFVAASGVPLTVVAREPENREFGDYVRGLRESAGFAVLPKGASARDILGRLKKGEAVGLLPDQNSGDVFVPFFGVPCGTVAGPAAFALRTGAALIPTYCVRKPDDTYKFIALPPVPVHSTGDKDADISRITQETNRVLEEMVRQYPDQWLWLHNRWKSAFETKNYPRAWGAETSAKNNTAYQSAQKRWNLLPPIF